MNWGKRLRWIITSTVLLTFMVVFLTQVEAVHATFTNMHAIMVLLRVETEIMQKTPAGQYYEALFWKHNDELLQISSQYPENNKEIMRVTRLFVPSLETLLNGEGDTVRITSEQVESLKSELNWLAAMGSPALREDIQREQQRLPLDAFIGMTMSEALDFINSTWTSDSPVNKSIVPGMDGKWASFVHNGIYFEYPSNYSLQISGSEKDHVYFIPAQDSPSQWHPHVMKVRFWIVPPEDHTANNPRAWFSHENVVWESSVKNTEFPGVEFIASWSDPSRISLRAFLYHSEKRLAVEVSVLIMESNQLPDNLDYSTLVNQQYEYFQHMVDTIKVDPATGSEFTAQQTSVPHSVVEPVPATVDKTVVPGSDGKWAYYVQDGVYLEYPSSYTFQLVAGASNEKYLRFDPQEWHDLQQPPYSIIIKIWKGSYADQERLIDILYSGSVAWERMIQTEDFKGIEYISGGASGEVMELGTILFNQEDERLIHMFVIGFSPVPSDSDFNALINQRYSYFQHMVDHIRIGSA